MIDDRSAMVLAAAIWGMNIDTADAGMLAERIDAELRRMGYTVVRNPRMVCEAAEGWDAHPSTESAECDFCASRVTLVLEEPS